MYFADWKPSHSFRHAQLEPSRKITVALSWAVAMTRVFGPLAGSDHIKPRSFMEEHYFYQAVCSEPFRFAQRTDPNQRYELEHETMPGRSEHKQSPTAWVTTCLTGRRVLRTKKVVYSSISIGIRIIKPWYENKRFELICSQNYNARQGWQNGRLSLDPPFYEEENKTKAFILPMSY